MMAARPSDRRSLSERCPLVFKLVSGVRVLTSVSSSLTSSIVEGGRDFRW